MASLIDMDSSTDIASPIDTHTQCNHQFTVIGRPSQHRRYEVCAHCGCRQYVCCGRPMRILSLGGVYDKNDHALRRIDEKTARVHAVDLTKNGTTAVPRCEIDCTDLYPKCGFVVADLDWTQLPAWMAEYRHFVAYTECISCGQIAWFNEHSTPIRQAMTFRRLGDDKHCNKQSQTMI